MEKRKQKLKDYFGIKDSRKSIFLTIGVWIDSYLKENSQIEIAKIMSKSLDVDYDSIEFDVDGGRGKSVICAEIAIDNKNKKALDFVVKIQDKLDKDLSYLGYKTGIILD